MRTNGNEPVIFLDMDGVLVTNRSHVMAEKKGGLMTIVDPVGAAMIKRLCEDFGCCIVVSSTWRFAAPDKLHDRLRECDLFKYLHFDRHTPQKMSSHRGQEIDMWLEKHPTHTKYLIIDDSTDMMSHQRDRFVKTDTYDGISYWNYLEMEKILQEQQDVEAKQNRDISDENITKNLTTE